MSEPRTKGRRYNWAEWFGQKQVLLYKDTDYNGLDHGFAQYIRRAAKRHGYNVSVEIREGHLLLTVHGATQPKPEIHNNEYRTMTERWPSQKKDPVLPYIRKRKREKK